MNARSRARAQGEGLKERDLNISRRRGCARRRRCSVPDARADAQSAESARAARVQAEHVRWMTNELGA
jgi:hypothetical protein